MFSCVRARLWNSEFLDKLLNGVVERIQLVNISSDCIKRKCKETFSNRKCFELGAEDPEKLIARHHEFSFVRTGTFFVDLTELSCCFVTECCIDVNPYTQLHRASVFLLSQIWMKFPNSVLCHSLDWTLKMKSSQPSFPEKQTNGINRFSRYGSFALRRNRTNFHFTLWFDRETSNFFRMVSYWNQFRSKTVVAVNLPLQT